MIKYRKLFFILFILLTPFVFSQAILLPSEEAPESIFSISPGGADVDLYLLGTWETQLRGGYGFSWNSENKSLQESSFPGMQSGLQLTHGPDIFISLWLMNSYFFEASFIDDYDLNTILFGYEAVDEGFLKSVRIGNTDIGFGNYSYLNIPKASTDSMGGMVLFNNEKTEHQLMLRYDPAEMQTKNYIGQYEVDASRTELTDYIKGRFFILPDDNVEDLSVYIEDSSGTYSDGTHKYRLADADDAIISSEEGIVFFRETLNSRAAVSYTKNSNPVGDASLGIESLVRDSDGLGTGFDGFLDIAGTDQFQFGTPDFYLGIDMDSWALSIDSETALLLYEPGVFSPFEMLSIYSLPYLLPDNPALFNTVLTDININYGKKLNISTTFEDYMVRILYDGDSLRNPANRYPLAASIDTDSLIYEPKKNLTGSPANKELLFQRLFPAGSYNLGDNVLDGSVSVKFNSLDEYRFTFNPDSGTVNFLFPIPSDAQIEISYRTMATTGISGDLLVALGSKFNFSDNLFMETGVGLRWNILDSSYIEHPGDASGSIIGTAGLTYKGENLNFKLDAGISVHSPNTTGILRLAGMNKGGFTVPVSANLLYPSALPETNITITEARGKLIYKDYHEYNSSGSSTLKDLNWSIPADQIYNYENGGRTGPYIISTNSEIEGNAAVLEYELADNEWVGGRIPLTLGSNPLDLSGTQSISLQWKHITGLDNVTIYLRMGKLSEDLDTDGILDREISEYDSGFDFNDIYNMKIGLAPDSSSGNDQIDTEDLDGNSILDKEGSNLVLTKTGGGTDFTEPGSSWDTLSLNLSPSDREMLKEVTGFEIIIVETSGLTSASGKLLIGDVIFSGSSFVTKPAGIQVVTAKEINEQYSSSPTPLLTTSYPEVSIFSSGTGAQSITEINWDITGDWETTTFTEAVDLKNYNKISFYMKTPDSDPSDITFSLINPSGEGISLLIPTVTVSPNWVKYTIDYRNGTLTIDGTDESGITWEKRDLNASNVNRLTLSATCTGGGSLLIDEVHMEDPVVGISGAAGTIFKYNHPGTIFTYKDTAILSNFSFSNSSSIKGPNFASGFTNNQDSTIYTATGLNISLLNMIISGNLNLQWQNTELYSSPGLSFSIPFFDNNLIIKDSFSEVNLPLASSTLRESSILAEIGLSSFTLSANSSHNIQNMIRNWKISSNTTLEQGYTLNGTIDFRMSGIENPYENMNFIEKYAHSYTLYLPGNTLNDRNTILSINPTFKFNTISLKIDETLKSNMYGTDERDLSSNQLFSIKTDILINPGSLDKWDISPGYIKSMKIVNQSDTDLNFITDTNESIHNIATQNYYMGIPIWEIIYPDFGTEFKNITTKEKNAEYNPEFSLSFSRLAGSMAKDIFIPSVVDISLSRFLSRNFDSVTDTLKINLETRSTALNVFGKLGTTPLVNWYQTEEISSILAASGEFRSYMTEILTDPVFTLNYSLYLNLSLSQKNSIEIQSSHNFIYAPFIWNSSSSGSYNWQVTPDNIIQIPLFHEDNLHNKPYFEHKEKITISTSSNYNPENYSFTITLNHSTDLVFTDKGNISIFAGLGFDQNSITNSYLTTKYYLMAIEAGISAKLTF